MNPFISFCLYVAARVFVQYLKSRPKDGQVRASLQFLLSAMHAIKRKNPLTESFLVQLDVDLESAGLENSRELRAHVSMKFSQATNRSPGCPGEHLGMGSLGVQSQPRPAYGDMGIAAYNDPNHTNVAGDPSAPGSTYKSTTATFSSTNQLVEGEFNFIPNQSQFDLPDRTPDSQHNSQTYRSPQSMNPGMDMSPDGSGDHQTPNSSTQSQQNASSHTSNTAYSPQNQQDPKGMMSGNMNSAAFFDPNDLNLNTFTTDFDMHSFPTSTAEQQQQGFVLPSTWAGASTGLTPGPTGGLTPSGISDMMGMTDADWSQVMDGFNAWDASQGTSIPHDTTMQEMLQQSRRS